MNNAQIVYQRLDNQRLSSSDFKRPADVVRWFGAVQAQDFNGAKWALAQRMPEATNAVIEKAYSEGKILRTHVMRPTWHFVAPDDIRWLLQLTASRVNTALGSNYRKFELDSGTFKRCDKILTSALKGGKYLTRASLKKILNDSGVVADDGVRLAHILVHAELDEVICSGPLIGKQFTYALLEERVPQTKALDREQALLKLTRRYFTSHGPAMLQDFVWWSGLTMADAKTGVSMNERHLTKTNRDGTVYLGPPSANTPQTRLQSAHLLPPFDEYTVAYKDRKAIFDRDHRTSSTTQNGILGPVVVVDGEVVGGWKGINDKEFVNIQLILFRPLNNSEVRAVRKAADRYSKFLGIWAKIIF